MRYLTCSELVVLRKWMECLPVHLLDVVRCDGAPDRPFFVNIAFCFLYSDVSNILFTCVW